MQSLLKGMLGLILVGLLVASFMMSGWSPLNLIFGPQYQASSDPKTDTTSRQEFIRDIVPEKYPTLISSVREHGAETIQWQTVSGEEQTIQLSIHDNQLVINTSIFTESNESVRVEMTDANLNGKMDTIRYTESSGRNHSYTPPFDETSQLLWDSALAISIQRGRCCQ